MQTIKDLANEFKPQYDTKLSSLDDKNQFLFTMKVFREKIAAEPFLFKSGHGYPARNGQCMLKSITLENISEIPTSATHIVWFQLDNGIYTEQFDKDDGDLMTVKDFVNSVADGMFIDYDGYGNPVRNNRLANIDIFPSQVHEIPDTATHILWYNR